MFYQSAENKIEKVSSTMERFIPPARWTVVNEDLIQLQTDPTEKQQYLIHIVIILWITAFKPVLGLVHFKWLL